MDLSQLKLTQGVNLTLVEVQSGATNIQHVENYFPNVTSMTPNQQMSVSLQWKRRKMIFPNG